MSDSAASANVGKVKTMQRSPQTRQIGGLMRGNVVRDLCAVCVCDFFWLDNRHKTANGIDDMCVMRTFSNCAHRSGAAKKRDVRAISISPSDLGPPPKSNGNTKTAGSATATATATLTLTTTTTTAAATTAATPQAAASAATKTATLRTYYIYTSI